MPEPQRPSWRGDSETAPAASGAGDALLSHGGGAFIPVYELLQQALAIQRMWSCQDAACDAFARAVTRRRALLGLLARPGARRIAAARAMAGDAESLLCNTDLQSLLARRPLLGLIRRPRPAAEAIMRQAISRTLADERRRYLADAGQPLALSGFAQPEIFAGHGSFGAQAAAIAAIIDRLRMAGWGTPQRPLPGYLAEQLARCGLGCGDAETVTAWVDQIIHGWQLYPNAQTMLAAATRVRDSELFDADWYSKRANIVNDGTLAALHYSLIGDAVGTAPSKAFDPAYYADRNPDVVERGDNRLLHYIDHGQREGRRAISPVPYRMHADRLDDTRGNIIIVVHETSRTGAPVLGWNIARRLAARYNLFIVLLGGGPLTDDFAALSTACIGPCEHHGLHPADLEHGLRRGLGQHEFDYAIVNSCESRVMLEPCFRRLIPALLLMHEFGSYVYARDSLRAAFDMAAEIVFPANLVAQSSLDVHPPLHRRPLRILPQGMSAMPGANASAEGPPPGLRHVAVARQAGAFIVLGAGSVTFRKGVDLFLSAAMAVCAATAARPVHFVWIGRGYLPEEDMAYSIYLREQMERSGMTAHVTFVDELPDLEPAYAMADVFLLASRLDPMPNVSIDAALRGIPVVCFQGASGTADILSADPATSALVVGHLDAAAAARAILALAADGALRQRIAAATQLLARSVFDMETYCNALDELGRNAARRFRQFRREADTVKRCENEVPCPAPGAPLAFETSRQAGRSRFARGMLAGATAAWPRAEDTAPAAASGRPPAMPV